MTMPSVELNTGANMPQIGFGTWQIWLNGSAKKAVLAALEAGYRLIDTAKIYRNEKGVGAALKESGIARQDLFITTKLWNWDQGYDKALKAFDESLDRLQLDYVDLYLIHWPATEKRGESWKALEKIYQSGRAKAIGVSNYTVAHLEELLADCQVIPAVNQVEFHPFIWHEQAALLDFCRRKGIVLEAYSPLAQGKLNHPVITDMARSLGKTNGQIMLRWAIQKKTIPIPKSSHPERIRENLQVFDFELSTAQVKQLDDLSSGRRVAWDPTRTP